MENRMIKSDTKRHIVTLITPFMLGIDERNSIVTSAFFGSPLLDQISWEGAAPTFTTQLVETAIRFGEVAEGELAIVVLLKEVSSRSGRNTMNTGEELIQRILSETSGSSPSSNISIEGDVSGGNVNIGGSTTIHGDGNIVNPPPGNDGQNSSSDEVNFRMYSPPVAEINTRSSIHVYAFVTSTLKQVEEDIQRFQTDLGGVVPKPKEAKQTSMVERDTPITVIPESDELEFEPATLTKKWYGDWTRYDFDFRPPEGIVDETVFVRVSIQIEGIEIAHIKCAIEVEQPTTKPSVSSASMTLTTTNPLAKQKYISKTTTPYQRIFISYSRRDTQVARSYKLAQTALGNDVFLDVDNLRSGENWQAGLAKAIDEADIFQLFWSEHSAESQYCRYEWEYALGHRCPDTQCEAFVRPVYWTKPMPKVPEKLRELNFKFVPFEQTNETTD